MIRKLLIANRGEIACRIVRTARRMGIATVAVHSDADAQALHVGLADGAVRIGPAEAAKSYLDIDAILDAASKSGADAVHPGYGFLSENAGFAAACEAAGLTFVGPPVEAIRAMGDKARAKALMREAGVPVVPGYDGDEQEIDRLRGEAERIGYPILVKASAGGGGRGMRRVDDVGGLEPAVESAKREAQGAFGDRRLLLEKLVEPARHIEVQVFGDRLGNLIHLGERDCSAQRRHQKVIEEAPSPALGDDLRAVICADGLRAASAVGYVGAGTVEFVLGPDGDHYFLEMNTRLQVEHPVTEMVTGIDLVEWQLRVAAGERLPLSQDEVRVDGHAVEARLYAEDPYGGFLPQAGPVEHWRPRDDPGAGVRIDNGIAESGAVTPFYDPMIAKFIAYGASRAEAIAKLKNALVANPLFGPATNRGFLVDLLDADAFAAGDMTTELIDRWVEQGDDIVRQPEPSPVDVALAACVIARVDGDWFRSSGQAECPVTLTCMDKRFDVRLRFDRERLVAIDVDGTASGLGAVEVDGSALRFDEGGIIRHARVLRRGSEVWVDLGGRTLRFHEPDPLTREGGPPDPTRVVSPVAGMVREVSVAVGDVVRAGDRVAVIEAMKMETELVARAGGRVGAVLAVTGGQIGAGDIVVRIEIDAASEA